MPPWLTDYLVPIVLVTWTLLCGLTAALAARKGYDGESWALAIFPLGMIVLAFLPHVNRGTFPPDVAARKKEFGNRVGTYLTRFSLLALLLTAWQVSQMK